MAIALEQATARTLKSWQFLDATDAVTPETGLTIQKADVRLTLADGNIVAANADQGASDAGAPHDELGKYDLSLDATDTATRGRLVVTISKSGALPVEVECEVLSRSAFQARMGLDQLRHDGSSDTDSGTALKTAVEALVYGDTLYVGPGLFDLGTSAITQPAGTKVIGSGEDVTTITSNSSGSIVWKIAVGGYTLTDRMTINNTAAAAAAFGATGAGERLGCHLRHLKLFGASDAFYYAAGGATAWFLDHVTAESEFDAFILQSGPHKAWLYNCHFRSVANDTFNAAKCIGASGGAENVVNIYAFDCSFDARDGSTQTTGVSVNTINAHLYLTRCSVHVSGSANIASVSQAGFATSITCVDCEFDRSLQVGTVTDRATVVAKLPTKDYLTGTDNADGDPQEVTGDVGGKVLGGGSGTIAGTGARADLPDAPNPTAVEAIQAGLGTESKQDTAQTSLNDIPNNAEFAAAFPANFAAMGINVSGHVSRVTLVDTTTTNTDMRGTDGANTTTPDNAGIGAAQTAAESVDTKLGEPANATFALDFASMSNTMVTVANRLGAWSGSGLNTVLGGMRAIFRKDADAAVPDDINTDLGGGAGTADNTTDSNEAIRDRGDAAYLTAAASDIADAVGERALSVTPSAGTWDEAMAAARANAKGRQALDDGTLIRTFYAHDDTTVLFTSLIGPNLTAPLTSTPQ
jgi:hypothetical protein